ncbi:WhiB family redox-sensing transcriptional regulator [Rhodococcus sp. OK519]|uniref:WhiB family transcriptional regulator n=1 Tax=Rhodococcus sp. OK519 TaxID=2135729 RepID=UPI000D34AEFE|nr:WhiB family redox-sensing transcriptional regulator [Rhodococcus sp. OK519]
MPISASRTEVEYEGRTPCRTGDLDLWFSPVPADLERAKRLCGGCAIRTRCLIEALDRAEPWGVWGGEILHRGVVVARKRPRGRPRPTAGRCRTVAS